MQDVLWQSCSLFRVEPCSKQFRLFFSKPSVSNVQNKILNGRLSSDNLVSDSPTATTLTFSRDHAFPFLLHCSYCTSTKSTCAPNAEDVIFPIQKRQKGVLVGCNSSLWTWTVLDTRYSAEFSWRRGMQSSGCAAWLSSSKAGAALFL